MTGPLFLAACCLGALALVVVTAKLADLIWQITEG